MIELSFNGFLPMLAKALIFCLCIGMLLSIIGLVLQEKDEDKPEHYIVRCTHCGREYLSEVDEDVDGCPLCPLTEQEYRQLLRKSFGREEASRGGFRKPQSNGKCSHPNVYCEYEVLGSLASVVCEDCGERWGPAGSYYVDRGDPDAIAKQQEYERQLKRAR